MDLPLPAAFVAMGDELAFSGALSVDGFPVDWSTWTSAFGLTSFLAFRVLVSNF